MASDHDLRTPNQFPPRHPAIPAHRTDPTSLNPKLGSFWHLPHTGPAREPATPSRCLLFHAGSPQSHQDLPRPPRRGLCELHHPSRRDPRLSRPQRRRQKHHRQDADRPAGTHQRARPLPWPGHPPRFEGLSAPPRLRPRGTPPLSPLERPRVFATRRPPARPSAPRAGTQNGRTPAPRRPLGRAPRLARLVLQGHAPEDSPARRFAARPRTAHPRRTLFRPRRQRRHDPAQPAAFPRRPPEDDPLQLARPRSGRKGGAHRPDPAQRPRRGPRFRGTPARSHVRIVARRRLHPTHQPRGYRRHRAPHARCGGRMTARLRQWLEETHSDTFELVRHFLARFFDTEIGASAGDWHKVAIGIFASLVSLGILGFTTYLARFRLLQDPAHSTPQLYHATVHADFLGLLAITMALTALLTLLQWQSLFPSLRDYMALTGFPVSARQIFAAKFGALVLVFAAYAISLTGPLAGFFGWVIRGNWQENPSGTVLTAATFAALAGASAFVFFALLALQGGLLNFVPGRWFLRVSLFVQAVLFIATVGALPLLGRQPHSAAWWPPVWFVWLWDALVTGHASARPALLAVVLPAVLAVLSYLLSYHRYRKLLLEAPPAHAGGHSGLGSRLLEWWIPNPREQAAFAFTWKTLARSRIHRLLAAPPVALHDEGMFGLMAVASPLGLAVLMILALRYLFTLPVTFQANWMFQTADQEGRAAWLAAVQRFVIVCSIVPVYLASLPATVAILGWLRALAVTALGALVALLCFERLFRNWCKLPFTCSYLPGKVMVWMLLFRASVGMVYFAAIPPLLLSASGELASFIALFTGLFLLWRRWRRVRLAQWAENTLLWEEAPEAEVQALHLGPLERDASLTTTPQPAPEMFSAGMVASRGLLPQAWEEEIAEERSHPGALLATFWEDVRYGCRVIRRNPLLSLVVVLTLTVGIGINASIFTVVNGMMLRPHIYKDPDSFLRVVPESRLQGVPRRVSYQEYLGLRDHTRSEERRV